MVRRIDKAEDHRNDGKHYAGLLSRGEYNKRKAHVEDTVDMQAIFDSHCGFVTRRQQRQKGLLRDESLKHLTQQLAADVGK